MKVNLNLLQMSLNTVHGFRGTSERLKSNG